MEFNGDVKSFRYTSNLPNKFVFSLWCQVLIYVLHVVKNLDTFSVVVFSKQVLIFLESLERDYKSRQNVKLDQQDCILRDIRSIIILDSLVGNIRSKKDP